MSFRDPQSIRYFGSVPVSSQVKRVLLQRKTKEKNEHKDNEDSPQAPDSTTEPPKPAHDFQEGDDVFFQNEEGQNILGTIGQVTPLRCQILFGDGTQQWAAFKRIKKLSCSFNEPSTSFQDSRESEAKKKVKTELVCIVCKGIKKISSKKAESYSAETPFTCARCTAAKVVPIPAKVVANLSEAYQRSKVIPRQVIRRTSTGSSANTVPVPSKSPVTLGSMSKRDSRPKQLISYIPHRQGSPPYNSTRMTNHSDSNVEHYSSGLTMKPMKTSVSVQLKTSPIKSGPKNNLCFHCEERTCPYNRVHCHMCERYCHLMCLQLTSVPLEGDKFWDVMCSACGTQNGSDKEQNRVFSVRRSINSWSDVVHLIINCLKVKSMGQQYFDFDTQIIPFFDSNMDKLHLPSKFKSASPEDRKNNLLAALTSSRLRFTKRKGPEKIPTLGEAGKTLWALRSDKSNQSDSSPEAPATSSTSIRLPNRNLLVSSVNNTLDNSSEMDISPPPVPKAALPLSLKNLKGTNSSALSIFSIPSPYGNTNNVSPTTGTNVSYPRVLSKETVLKSPITTNIVLAPTNSTTSTTARFSSKGITTTTKGTNVQIPQKEESNHRQRLRIRLPLKPPSTEKEKDKEPPALSPARPDLSTPKKNNTNKLGTEGPRPRKRLLSSGGEDSDKDLASFQPPKQSKTVPLSPTMPQLTKQDQSSGISVKSPEPISSTAAREAIGHPAVPSLRLSITRGRPKLLRSTVLNSTNKSIRGKSSRGRGRPVSRLIPPKESSNSSQNSNDSSSRSSSAITLNGMWKLDPKVPVANGTQSSTNGLKIKKVPWNPPPPPSPEAEDAEDDSRKTFYGNLLNAAMFTGLRVQCLPKPLEKESAKRAVAALYLDDANCSETDEPENNNKEQMTSKIKNRFGKSLDDLDSYEIAATKIGPDGIKRYLVVWKEPVQDRQLDFDEEIDRLFFRSRADSIKNKWLDQNYTLNGCRIKSETDKKYATISSVTKNGKQLDSEIKRVKDDDITILKHSPAKSSSSSGTSSKNNSKHPVTCFIDLTDSS